MRPRLGIVALVLAGAIALAGCITPSIPIPPPDPGEMDFDVAAGSDGVSSAVMTYPATSVYHGGVVYVFNQATGMGVFQDVNADDSIGPTQPLAAKIGDQVSVTIELQSETVSVCVVLQQGTQDPDIYCQ